MVPQGYFYTCMKKKTSVQVTAKVKQLVIVLEILFQGREKTVYTHVSKKNSGIFSNNSVTTAG